MSETRTSVLCSVLDTDAFLRVFTLLALMRQGHDVEDAVAEAKTKRWKAAIVPFLVRFFKSALVKSDLDSALDAALSDKDPNGAIDSFLRRLTSKDTKTNRTPLDYVLADDSEVPSDRKMYLKYVLTYARSGTEKSLEEITKRIGMLGSRGLNQALAPHDQETGHDVSGQDDLIKSLRQIGGKKTGSPFLNRDEVESLKKSDPKTFASYSDTLKQLTTLFKETVASIMRSEGLAWIKLDDLRKKLKAAGLKFDYFAKISGDTSFIYVNEKGGISVGPEGGDEVVMGGRLFDPNLTLVVNPKYDPETDDKYVIAQMPGPGYKMRQSWTTVGFVKNRRTAGKEEAVGDLTDNIKEYSKKWRADLKSDNEILAMTATIVELLYLTAARAQSRGGSSKGQSTFGIQSILVKHVRKIGPSEAKLEFLAKSGKLYKVDVKLSTALPEDKASLRQVLHNLQEYVQDKRPNDRVFSIDGKILPVNSVNIYLKERIGSGASAHKFRHLKGNKTFLEAAAKTKPLPKNAKQAEVDKRFREIMTHVAEALGHTVTTDEGTKPNIGTSIKNYVSPHIMRAWYAQFPGVRPFSAIPSAGSGSGAGGPITLHTDGVPDAEEEEASTEEQPEDEFVEVPNKTRKPAPKSKTPVKETTTKPATKARPRAGVVKRKTVTNKSTNKSTKKPASNTTARRRAVRK